ncbi:MAG: sulfate adenylyltransferase [Gemmatimonadaceae bacterium]|nr:sulfate adenylyltransferase [Gemmatimonadaceae bacterium]
MSTTVLPITEDDLLDVINLVDGAFAPLTGFLGGDDYRSVIDAMCLADGTPWTIPVTLAVDEAHAATLRRHDHVHLVRATTGEAVATLDVHDLFRANPATDIAPVYGVTTHEHPGVRKELARSPRRVGGTVRWLDGVPVPRGPFGRSPAETRAHFAQAGWRRVVGFQTRNPIHRAHEHLQRSALEVTDGLFVQPLVGWKAAGDFTTDAVLAAYDTMARHFYPRDRVLIGTLATQMRYAGPREAVFHAIIRRNFGCTHFIVGRDHAGVGNYYGLYDAQRLCLDFGARLGIEILALGGPFHCTRCLGPATEHTCGHDAADRREISGTLIRSLLARGERPAPELMRTEIADVLIALQGEQRLFHAAA